MKDIRAEAIALYDRFTHQGMDRRDFMARLTKLAGSAAAANALLMGIAANPAAAAVIAEDDPRVQVRDLEWEVSPGRKMKGYGAAPADAAPGLPLVIVIHENRGLNAHIRDVARRVAVHGYSAVAPDFLSSLGGTPADEDEARAMFGKLDLPAATADAVAMVKWLASPAGGSRKVGAMGFCWGGAMTTRLAVASGPELAAAVPFYGPAPAVEEAAKVQTPLLVILAERDERVNATALPFVEALKAAGKPVESIVYPGTEHAFHNDTSAERYDEAAARDAWTKTMAFLGTHLGAVATTS